MREPDFFDPLDYDSLGRSVARALIESEPFPLVEVEPFEGMGLYALTYTGGFGPYHLLADANRAGKPWPIYVGKADSGKGSRKGNNDATVQGKDGSTALYNRINKHRRSIDSVDNLEVSDFQIRLMTMPPVWVPVAEQWTIRQYSPLWNQIVDGFGNHDPGTGRHGTAISVWDTLHPGRTASWTANLVSRSDTPEQIAREIERRLRETQPK